MTRPRHLAHPHSLAGHPDAYRHPGHHGADDADEHAGYGKARQLGRARAGRTPGGLAYGYEVVPQAAGAKEGGERRIVPTEAAVVV